jgi:phage pi2 protein 07
MLKKLIKIIQYLEYRKLIIYRMIHWYMIGFRQYNKSKHFKAPEVKNKTPEYSKMLLDYYENGIVEIPTDNFEELNANFLESIQSLFEESICINDSTPLK